MMFSSLITMLSAVLIALSPTADAGLFTGSDTIVPYLHPSPLRHRLLSQPHLVFVIKLAEKPRARIDHVLREKPKVKSMK